MTERIVKVTVSAKVQEYVDAFEKAKQSGTGRVPQR
jgi:hypothetical protein